MPAKIRVDVEFIQRAVSRVRDQNIMLDSDLALLYQVDVKVLNQAVKRNRERFPADFMFQLTSKEAASLRSPFVTANASRGGRPLRSQIVTLDSARGRHRKYPPKAFTEQGVAMLSSVLRSRRAVMVNIEIMRTFVQLRRVGRANEELARKLDALERKYDGQFHVVFEAIRQLMGPSRQPRRAIGFGRNAST
jgi:hypothetical protein